MAKSSTQEAAQRVADVVTPIPELFPEVKNLVRNVFLGHFQPFIDTKTKPSKEEIEEMAGPAEAEAAEQLRDFLSQPEVSAVITSSESFKWLMAELNRTEAELLIDLVPALLIEIVRQFEVL